jgi:NADPH2:quinone reductase
MLAILLKDYDGAPSSLSLNEIPTPTLKHGQVLVKMAATPINPSDLIFLKGQYGITKPVPVVPGFEGSGTVVDTGGGWLARRLLGKRVACRAPEDGHGTWAEYMVVSAEGCLPLFSDISSEQGACLIVNPMTAVALFDKVRLGGHQAFVQTAAASALGLMMVRLAQRHQVIGIHVVRRPEQVKTLKELGCEYVFDVNDALFNERLGEACYKFQATIAFDAVGGDGTAQLANAMPQGSRIIVYGALSGQDCRLGPHNLIFHGERLEGFWLSDWIKTKNLWQKMRFANNVQRLLRTDLNTHIQARFPLSRYAEAIELYKKQRSSGKVLFTPSGN